MGKLAPVSTLRGGGHKNKSNEMMAKGCRDSQKASSKMMAEGHWDSQKASRKETRTSGSRAEVQGDRQEKGQEGEGIEEEGAQTKEEENNSRGGGGRKNSGVGGDMNQGAIQRTEVGCHWSGSESGVTQKRDIVSQRLERGRRLQGC